MLGLQTPIVVARYPSTNVYLATGVGLHKEEEVQHHFMFNRGTDFRMNRTVLETTIGTAVLVGLELFLDK